MTTLRSLQDELGIEGEREDQDGRAGISGGGVVETALDPFLEDIDPLDAQLESLSDDERSSQKVASLDDQPGHTAEHNVAAAERFKYTICSSGLLDKDFLTERHEPMSAVSGSPVEAEAAPRTSLATLNAQLRLEDVARWAKLAMDRWDLSLAGLVLVVGLMVVIGWKRFLCGIVAVTGGIGAGVVRKARNTCSPPSDLKQEHNVAEHISASEISPLDRLLAASSSLDSALRTCLTYLDPSSKITFRKDLRMTLHQTCDALNDHLADASSALGNLVDKEEFKVLAAMYDIPLVRRKVDSDKWDEAAADVDTGIDLGGLGVGAIPSPRRQSMDRFFSPASTVRPARPRSMALAPVHTSWEMGAYHSLPITTPIQTGHSRHLSLLPSLPVNIQSATPQTDRFTSLPRKTPRLSKRASWDSAAWRKAKDPDASAQLSAPLAIGNQLTVSPLHPAHTPKRTSPLSGKSPEMISRPSLTESALRIASLGSPSAPASKRNSLQARLPASANPNRRSLHSLTYFPADASDMLRTASSSTTVSDLQQARERASDGDRRRRLSMRSNLSISSMQSISPPHIRQGRPFPSGPLVGQALPRIPSTLAPGRPDRVASLSPLTHPALQAACLGVHLRRRRVACELLALRWAHASADEEKAYWDEVEGTVDSLVGRMEEAVQSLKTACTGAQAEPSSVGSSPTLGNFDPPWRRVQPISNMDQQWAPRTSDEQHLSDRVRSIQAQLEAAWTASNQALVKANGSSGLGDSDTLTDILGSWADLQAAIGEMSREIGAGKAILRDRQRAFADSGAGEHTSEDEPLSDVADDLPDFARNWDSDSHTARSTSIGTVISDNHLDMTEAANDDADHLPAVGRDEVFEALVEPEKRRAELAGMSRNDRIALTKKAREMGVSVKELLQAGGDNGEAQADLVRKKQIEKAALLARSGLVDELQTMMGAIHRRKGLGQGDELQGLHNASNGV